MKKYILFQCNGMYCNHIMVVKNHSINSTKYNQSFYNMFYRNMKIKLFNQNGRVINLERTNFKTVENYVRMANFEI